MNSFAVLIPFYHDEKNFKLCFNENYQRIKRMNPDNEVIIVDDTGNEAIYPIIQQRYKDNVKVIKHDINKGFSISVNEGIQNAKSKIVFVFNSDILTTESTFHYVLPHFDDDMIFAVSLKSIYPNGKIREGAKKIVWKSGLPQIKHSQKDFPKPTKNGIIYSIYPVGGHFAVRRDMFIELNGYDYKLFHPFYWEDTDLGIRALKKGWKIIYEPRAEVIHPMENSSIKSNFDKEHISITRKKNRIFFILKNFQSPIQKMSIRLGLLLRFFSLLLKFKSVDKANKLTFHLIKEYKRLTHENRSFHRRTGR